MAARLDTPVFGVRETYAGPNRWQFSTSWRHQRSDRHFRGSHEEANRQAEGSEVINTINLLELGIHYNPTEQWSFALAVPFLMAERSNPIRGANGVVIDRTVTEANSLSDITLMARRQIWKPREHPNGNLSVGLGVKFPTGDYDAEDTRTRLVNGLPVASVESVDQSIQPGDGGWGMILDFQAYQRIQDSGGALYASGAYLINPRNTNGTPTFRGSLGEEIMSVADQYLLRAGASYAGPSWKGFGFSLGGRVEGVPVEDLIGDSDGFRRPGYAVSVEPGLGYSRGPHSVSLSVPVALYRNRTRSVPDRAVPGRHGDAAFADYLVMLGYWRRY